MYEIIDLTKKEKWQSLLDRLPVEQRDIYFSPAYYQLCQLNGDGQAKCFVFDNNGELALYPFLVNSIQNLGLAELDTEYYDIQGVYGYNGVISSNRHKDFIREFYKTFNEYCRKSNIIAEFIRFHPLMQNQHFCDQGTEVSFNRQTVCLNLVKGYDYIWEKCYDSRNRNMIRKAVKNDFKIRLSTEGPAYSKFCELYTATMQKVQADSYYFFSEDYFHNLAALLGNHQCLMEVLHEDKVISAVLLLFYANYAHYHLSAREPDTPNLGANNYAIDAAIKYAIEAGCGIFHFGGGNSNLSTDTLFKFKTSFSKERKNFFIGKKIHNLKIYRKIRQCWEEKYCFRKKNFSNELLCYRR